MKRSIKIALIAFAAIIVIVIGTIITMNILNDENKLTVDEKKWINNNLSTVINVNMINDLNVFGNNGSGLFYDFINDLSNDYGLTVNPVTYNSSTDSVTSGFITTNNIDDKTIVFYEDNYVLVGKEDELIDNINELADKTIGVLTSNYNYILSYLDNLQITFNQYDTKEALEEAFGKDLNYIIVPKYLYMDYIIKNDYPIVYHFSDIKYYYGYKMLDDYFSNIVRKYYSKWSINKQDSTINTELRNSLINSLGLTDLDLKEIDSKVYNYGFLNNSPYEIIIGGNYGGIVSTYLNRFSKIAQVEFKFTKYRTYKLLTNAINDGTIDIYFNYYSLTNNYLDCNTNMGINYYVIARNSNDIVVNSIMSLKGKSVYVLQDSILADYLKTVGNITINTYNNINDLEKLVKDDNIIIIDKYTYQTYANHELANYNIRYSDYIPNEYSFKIKDDGAFYRLFKAFVNLSDPKEIIISGIYNYDITLKSGTLLGKIAKYLLYIVIGFFIVLFIVYKSAKRVKISKRIKKQEKLRYIDQLTSLKNRNYLNEYIGSWNKNIIYPQATVVIDLNRVQEINDTLGYEKGDKQIKATANILIKTQLDNSDIIRTDGNEFLVYLVGYDEKEVNIYIKKLNKEFKNLPYEFGATVGYSMITDDLKSIEDAFNEAVEDMKSKKSSLNKEQD